jgi:hypothetical protein
MTDAIRDNNHVPIALGVSSTDATVTLPFKIDSATGRLLTNSASGSGDVVGPASATDNAIARFDSTTGKLIQNSVVTVADTTGVIAGTEGVTLSGTTSGTTALVATAVAGTTTLTLPAATDTLVGRDTTDTLTNKSISSTQITIPVLNSPTYTSGLDFSKTSTSTGIITGGVISDGGSGTVDITAGTLLIRSTDSSVGDLYSADFSSATGQVLTDNSANYIYVQYNAGTPNFTVSTTPLADVHTNVICGIVYREGTTVHITNVNTPPQQVSQKLGKRLAFVDGLTRQSGALISETGTRNIAITAANWWLGLTEATTPAFDSNPGGAADTFTYYYNVSGTLTAQTAQSDIKNTQYDDGTDIATLGNGKYGVSWVYVGIDNDVYVILGTTNGTLAEAEAANTPTDLPPQVTGFHAALVGKIIIKKSDAVFTEILSPFTTTITAGTATDHADLANLAWTNSLHTGTATRIAGFEGAGAAAEYTMSGTGTELALTTSPTFVTPVLGTPTSGALTNCTAYPGDSSLVTTGALNSGSITSGFGSIDNGASAITTTGTVTGGVVVADDINLDGKVITMTGSASDTAVFTAGTNGTLSIVTTDTAAAAANIQITADGTVDIDSAGVLTLDSGAAINLEPAVGSAILLDGTISVDAGVVTGATSITSTTFVGALTGQADTVATIAGLAPDTATTQATQAAITTCANLVTVGALNSGSITSGFGTIDTGASTITTTGDITGGTFAATGDTAAADNASIGYTAVEGLIATGQGSTYDVTIKNDADATVLGVETGTTIMRVASELKFVERADHESTPGAGFGYLWVKSDIPSSLIYTDDAGTDTDLTASGAGDVTGDTASADKELVRFNGTTGKIIESPVTDVATTTATLSDNADLTLYDAVIDGNPVLSLGSSATERLTVTSSYASGTQELEFVSFDTPTASVTADRGEYRFNVDAALIATIDDGGIELANAKSYFIDTSEVLSETTLGSTVLASSLTSVGALAGGSITSGFGSIDNGASAITTTGTITGGVVIADDINLDGKVITMTGSASDTAVFTAGTNGTLSIVTTDTAAAAANIQITADGTVDIDSAGVLTLDSGAAINIEPAVGSAILLDGTISVDAGVVTGATSITSTTFVGALTGQADTVATITGLAPDTATTQATQAAITTCANLVTVGALNAGSITSGFGSIDNGASNITTTGDISGGTVNATSDTAAGDNAAIGYTATEGLVVTGQGSVNDITIKNDADADVLVVPTGTTNVDIVGMATAASFEPDGDTAAGDNAAIGYTATEGIIVTGQGSVTDVTIKNDADETILAIPTGTNDVNFGVDGAEGALILAEKTSIQLDPAGGADGDYSGITVTGTGGATIEHR